MLENVDRYKSIIEALLFTWGDELSIKDISQIIDLDKNKTEKILDEMLLEYREESRGLILEKREDKYQIGTKPELFSWVSRLNKPVGSRALSNAALETLSIIAYRQPVIKSDIEAIRGVKSDTAIYTLLDKELIEEKGRLDRIGRPILYGTTSEFLRIFGLESLDDLPDIESLVGLEDSVENISKQVIE